MIQIIENSIILLSSGRPTIYCYDGPNPSSVSIPLSILLRRFALSIIFIFKQKVLAHKSQMHLENGQLNNMVI